MASLMKKFVLTFICIFTFAGVLNIASSQPSTLEEVPSIDELPEDEAQAILDEFNSLLPPPEIEKLAYQRISTYNQANHDLDFDTTGTILDPIDMQVFYEKLRAEIELLANGDLNELKQGFKELGMEISSVDDLDNISGIDFFVAIMKQLVKTAQENNMPELTNQFTQLQYEPKMITYANGSKERLEAHCIAWLSDGESEKIDAGWVTLPLVIRDNDVYITVNQKQLTIVGQIFANKLREYQALAPQ